MEGRATAGGRPVGYNAGGWNMSSLISELPKPGTESSSLYRRDGYTWAKQQAAALRDRDLDAVDWDNVIEEIEGLARAERNVWVAHCAQAIVHMLAVEHCKTAGVGTLRKWETEIGAFRIGMASAIDSNLGLQGEYAEMLSMAWRSGRAYAVERLAGYAAEAAGAGDSRPFRRAIRAQLPEDCPYLVEHVAAYDPKLDKEPRDDVWPPGVAVRLNAALEADYEIRRGPDRGRGPGWSR